MLVFHAQAQMQLNEYGWGGWFGLYVLFNSISVGFSRISTNGEHERLCATKRRLGSEIISLPSGFEPDTMWSEVGSANLLATWALLTRWIGWYNGLINSQTIWTSLISIVLIHTILNFRHIIYFAAKHEGVLLFLLQQSFWSTVECCRSWENPHWRETL